MARENIQREHIASEAADWFARLHEVAPAPAARQEEFARWLLRSPLHIEEYLSVTRLWADAGSLDDVDLEALIGEAKADRSVPNVIVLAEAPLSGQLRDGELPVAARIVTRPYRGKIRRAYAAAAGMMLALTALGGWLVFSGWLQSGPLTTAVGEQRSLALPDGSMVHLNTDTALRIALNDRERRLILEHGEARFSVARDARRPFLVVTPQATVRAVGTVFNVQSLQARTAVTVIEGRVAVGENSSLAPLELDAGQRAAVTQSGEILPDTGPGVERALAWTQRRLIFHDEPLSAVVTEFNRYHVTPLRIADPALAALKISGAFDAGDPASLVEYLQRYEQVDVFPARDGARLLRPAPAEN